MFSSRESTFLDLRGRTGELNNFYKKVEGKGRYAHHKLFQGCFRDPWGQGKFAKCAQMMNEYLMVG